MDVILVRWYLVVNSGLPAYGDTLRMCEERSASNVDWAQACLDYGERLESQGKTELGVAIALAIQRLALERLGEFDRAAEVESRKEEHRKLRRVTMAETGRVITQVVFSNPRLFFAYLAEIRTHGESAAMEKIAAVTERLLEQKPALACATA